MKHYLKDIGSSQASGSYKESVWPYVVVEVFLPCNMCNKSGGKPDQARSLLLTSPWVMSVSSSEFNLEQEYTTCECLFIFKALDSIISLKPKRLARFTPSKGTTCSDDCWKSASSLSKAPNTPSKWPISERNAGGLDFHGGILLYYRILTALTVSNFWNLFKNIGIYRNQLGFTLLQI